LFRRGKAGLVKLNATWPEAKQWISERMNRDVKVEIVTGKLTHFIVEPFLPHDQKDEYYVSISSVRDGDMVYFYHEGGVDIGDVDAKAEKYLAPTDEPFTQQIVVVCVQLRMCSYIVSHNNSFFDCRANCLPTSPPNVSLFSLYSSRNYSIFIVRCFTPLLKLILWLSKMER
jgi:hypothetical protein